MVCLVSWVVAEGRGPSAVLGLQGGALRASEEAASLV
jgi:hypothetical protein